MGLWYSGWDMYIAGLHFLHLPGFDPAFATWDESVWWSPYFFCWSPGRNVYPWSNLYVYIYICICIAISGEMQTNLGPLAPMLTCENVAQRTAVCGDGNWHGNRHVVQNEGSWRYVQYSIEWLVWICTHTDSKSPVNINLSQRGLCLLTNIRIRVLGVHYFPQIHPEVWSNIFLEARFDKGQVVWDDPWLNIELNLKRLVCVGEKKLAWQVSQGRRFKVVKVRGFSEIIGYFPDLEVWKVDPNTNQVSSFRP